MSGHCDPAFEAVRDAFAANFAERGEVGAAVCVIVDDEVVVDLVGGWADATGSRPWRPDTLVNFYSVGKAIVATLALQLVDDGARRRSTPRSPRSGPSSPAGGKADVTLRHALCHRAGVPAIRERAHRRRPVGLAADDRALAATEAWCEPGTRHAYHTNTYGHLIGEIVPASDRAAPRATQLRGLAGPLGADLWFGVPAPSSTAART